MCPVCDRDGFRSPQQCFEACTGAHYFTNILELKVRETHRLTNVVTKNGIPVCDGWLVVRHWQWAWFEFRNSIYVARVCPETVVDVTLRIFKKTTSTTCISNKMNLATLARAHLKTLVGHQNSKNTHQCCWISGGHSQSFHRRGPHESVHATRSGPIRRGKGRIGCICIDQRTTSLHVRNNTVFLQKGSRPRHQSTQQRIWAISQRRSFVVIWLTPLDVSASKYSVSNTMILHSTSTPGD